MRTILRTAILAILVVFLAVGPAAAGTSIVILNAATATGAGNRVELRNTYLTFQAYGTTSAGAGSVTVDIQVTNVETPVTADWITAGTITLTLGTTSTTNGFTIAAPWRHARANVTAISGTTATVTVLLGG